MRIRPPYLLFLGDVPDRLAAKTALGVLDWRPELCLGQMRLPACPVDLGLPETSPAEAVRAGAGTLVIGAVNAGGVLPEHWIDCIVEALEAGLDVASGLHAPLAAVPAIREAAERTGGALHDLRRPPRAFATGSGRKRSGRRLLTVGTDCSVGKKYTALALERAMREAGFDATFRATGQTGILIAGDGVPIDAVVSDFVAGAAEWLTPDAPPRHWDLVEGQGSLFHPSFAGVTLGLLHGAQPDAFVVCHEPTRTAMRGVAAPIPSIRAVIEATLLHGRLTNPDIVPVGIAVDTSRLDECAARTTLEAIAEEHGLPTTDPLRFGPAPLVEEVARRFGSPRT